MKEFDYLEPAQLEQAVSQASGPSDEYRFMAGATALMLVMRQRIVNPQQIISLRKIQALRGLAFDAQQGLRIGALTTHREIAESPVIRQHYPVVAYMASIMANPQVRNQGTLGGNLCYGDSSTDPATCLISHQARLRLFSAQGYREVALQDFYLGFFETALRDGEILVEILLPVLPEKTSGLYERFRKTDAEHRPTMNLCLSWRPAGEGFGDLLATVGAATKTPQRLSALEQLMRSGEFLELGLDKVAEIAAASLDYIDDSRSSAVYRQRVTRVVLQRALYKLLEKK